MNASAETFGYVSINEADLPPTLERDVSSRSVEADRPPAYGPEDAKVLVITFAEFECPACRRASQATHQIAGQFPGDVRMEFWNNPLAMHRTAEQAAVAALAAQRQGKFWEMHDLLFENVRHDSATLEEHAKTLDLDIEQFNSDLEDPSLTERVRQEAEIAKSLGSGNTPGYFINGKFYRGWASWPHFRNIVEREVNAANKLAQQGMSPAEIQSERALENNSDSETYEVYRINILEPGIEAMNK